MSRISRLLKRGDRLRPTPHGERNLKRCEAVVPFFSWVVARLGWAALICLVAPFAAAAAEKPLVVRLYRSLVTGVDPSRATQATTPMVELLSKQVNYPIQFRIAANEGEADLRKFGRKLSNGEIDLGVMWGIEAGWLSEEHSNIDLLAATSTLGGDVGWPSHLMVRPADAGKPMAALKGKRLAVIERAPIMDALFLQKAIEDANESPAGFFASATSFDTVPEAIRAVEKGTCDCLALNITMWARFVAIRAGAKNRLATIASSPVNFPDGVLVGDRVRINRMRPRLWDDLQRALLKIHEEEYGMQCVGFWRIDKFVSPDHNGFREIVRKSAIAYPLTRGLNPVKLVRDGGRPETPVP